MPYSSINRAVLIGNLTRDPELQTLPSGHNVCNLRIACNGSRRDPDGIYHERPSYFDVSVYGPQTDPVGRFLRKGSAVAVDGHLEWREWETTEGHKRQAVKIVADAVQFLDRRADGARAGGGSRDGSEPEEEVAAEVAEREVELVF